MPRSRSRSMSSRNCDDISRLDTVPVNSRSRSASVDLPWSMCAMMEKLRIRAGSTIRSTLRAERGLRKRRDEPTGRAACALARTLLGAGRLRSEELDRALDTFGQRKLRTPAEDLGGAADVDHAPALLARLGGAMAH